MSNGLKLAIIVFLLTLFVVVINPKMHKGIEISSSSNVVLKTNDNYVKNQDIKLSNKDNFKNSKIHKLNNIDSLKISNTNLKNVDNINESEIVITDKDIIDYEKRLMTEYRRRKALSTKPLDYDAKKNEHKEKPQPQIVLDPNYNKNSKNNNYKSNTEEYVKENIVDEFKDEEVKEPDNKEIYLTPNEKTQRTKIKYKETIVWNNWKSDLHNRIHNDISYLIPDNMPLGALYKYSFIIDRNGNVSDVNVKVIFPGISLDGDGENALKAGTIAFKKAIYNCGKRHFKGFPKGSQREYVKLELVVQMGFVNVYTKPGDFNDLESVFGFR